MVEEYQNRREKLAQFLPEHACFVSFAGEAILSTADEEYPFQIDYGFFYLTGIRQDQSILLMKKENGIVSTSLYLTKYDALKEIWHGIRLKKEEGQMISGIETVLESEDFQEDLQALLQAGYQICYDGESKAFVQDQRVISFLSSLVEKSRLVNLGESLMHLRMVKSPFEIAQIKKAIHNTKLGLDQVLASLQPGKYEYEIANDFYHTIHANGKAKLAFSTICASGKNAVILHYPDAKDQMKDGDLLLCDLGSDWDEYKGDISRTYPVNGKFSPRQRMVYEIVRRCNEAVLKYAKPGLTIYDLQNFVVDFFFEELKKIGLVSSREEVKKYYYHGVSHHLGLDTHDVSDRKLPLEEGNVISNEPGLYIAEWEIGVRIEDDILITKDGAINLSSEITKDPDEIERMMKKAHE